MCWWQPEVASGNAEVPDGPSSAETEQLCPGDGGRGPPGFVPTGPRAVRWAREPSAPAAQGREVGAQQGLRRSPLHTFPSLCLGEIRVKMHKGSSRARKTGAGGGPSTEGAMGIDTAVGHPNVSASPSPHRTALCPVQLQDSSGTLRLQ